VGRIALFVVVIGGGFYFLLGVVASRIFGTTLSPVTRVSLAVLFAVVAWTVLIWRFGDRLGQRDV